MTKKDYETLAGLITSTNHLFQKGRIDADNILPQLARFIAEDAKAERPRFDKAKFQEACGVDFGTIYMGV